MGSSHFPQVMHACRCNRSALQSTRLELTSRGHCAGVSVMISAGAKEVLMAWQLTWRGSHAPGNHAALQPQREDLTLEHQWLSTRPPPKGGLRPRSNAPGCNSRGTAHRCSQENTSELSLKPPQGLISNIPWISIAFREDDDVCKSP